MGRRRKRAATKLPNQPNRASSKTRQRRKKAIRKVVGIMEHVAFAIAGIGMAGVIGYAFWTKIRVLRLKADILDLAVDLRQSAIRLGKTDDPVYKWTFRLLKMSAGDFCEQISLPTIAYLAVVRKGKVEWPVSDDPELQTAIAACKKRFGQRMAQYILLETLGGLTILLLAFVLRCFFSNSVFAPRLLQ